MSSLLSGVADPSFQERPNLLKVTVAGRWEEALTWPSDGPPDLDAVARLLPDAPDVACEAFFGPSFFGLRRTGTPADRLAAVERFAGWAAAASTGAAFFTAVAASGVPLARDFEYAELGAEGAWNSVGAVAVPRPCDTLASFDRFWDSLRGSDLARDTAHDKALEFSFANGDGTSHWFGMPVSTEQRLVRTDVSRVLSRFCDDRPPPALRRAPVIP